METTPQGGFNKFREVMLYMNPLLIILILLGGALIWLICSFLYRPIGRIAKKLFDDAVEAMQDDDSKDNKKK